MRKWERVGEWCVRSGPWRVTKAMINGVPRYELTHDGKTQRWCGVVTHKVLGVFESAKAAMESAK